MKFSKKFWFWWIFWKLFDFVHPIWLKISKNFNFFENFETISIFVKIFKISILVKFSEKFPFWLNFRKISIFSKSSKNYDFSKIFENVDFGQFFQNFDFVQVSEKNSILVNVSQNFRFCSSDLTKNFDKFQFFLENFEKISIFVEIFENFRF